MASVINKTTNQYIQSVNTPDYSEDDWIISPDLSAVAGVPQKYWKVLGGAVVEMTSEEKAAVDTMSAQIYIEGVIKSAISFGQGLIRSYAAQNVLLGITQAGKTNEVRHKMADVVSALGTGSLYDAISLAKSIDPAEYDSTFITAARLLDFINKIEAFLGIELSTSL